MVVCFLALAVLGAAPISNPPSPIKGARLAYATLLDDGRTAVLAVQNPADARAVSQDARALAHVDSVKNVSLGDGRALLLLRTDVKMKDFAATLDAKGLHAHFTPDLQDDFDAHVRPALRVTMPPSSELAQFTLADADVVGHRDDDARRRFELLVQDYPLHQWALLRLADLSAVGEGKAAGCAGYRHVVTAAPLHLAAHLATLRAAALGCTGLDLPPWNTLLQKVRRDDEVGQLLLREGRWAFWRNATPSVAAEFLDGGADVMSQAERRKLVAIAALGLQGDAQETFVLTHLKAIATHPDEAIMRMALSESLCSRHKTVGMLLAQKPWSPPKPAKGWAAAWRGHLTHCTSHEPNESLASVANTDVALFDRLLLSAGKRLDAVQALVQVADKSPIPKRSSNLSGGKAR